MNYEQALKEQKKQNRKLIEDGFDFMAISPQTVQLSGAFETLSSLNREMQRIERDIESERGRYEALRAVIGVTLAKREAQYDAAIEADLALTRKIAAQPPT